MITKITAENSELYYAPAFELINRALEDAGSELRIDSLTSYFNNISTIEDLVVNKGMGNEIPGGYLLLMPADEEIFEINANTRVITVPTSVRRNGIGVYGDHRAEMIVFSIDRYFDNQDLLNTKVAINWNFTATGAKDFWYPEKKASRAFAPNSDLNPDKVMFGFIINKEMTPTKGTLTFSVTFYTEGAEGIDYSLNTLIASVAINDTLPLLEPEIIVDDTENYRTRFMNSVYPNNTISSISKPEWKSGYYENHEFSGLDKVAYFSTQQDLNNDYSAGLDLSAYAVVVPGTADVNYIWSASPLEATEGTIAMGRTPSSQSFKNDYIKIQLPGSDDGNTYYLEDAERIGRIDTTNPLTWTQAKNLINGNTANAEPFLNLFVKKINPIESLSNDIQFNQNNVQVSVIPNSNIIYLSALEELREFALEDQNSEVGKWVGLDIDTTLETIAGISLNNVPLTDEDIDNANALELGNGHIVFWINMDTITNSKTITLNLNGYHTTTFKVKDIGVYPSLIKNNEAQKLTNKLEGIPTFYVKGSTFKAFYAGNYQVDAQATINGGDYYEQILPDARLEVGTSYYLKVNNNIDTEHEFKNEEAQMLQTLGNTLYVKANSSRSSEVAESSILTIPPALQPKVTLSIESTYEFDTYDEDDINWQGVIEDIDSIDHGKYTYIDTESLPTVIADISLETEDQRDYAGSFAVELIKSDAPDLTKTDIENNSYNFKRLPLDHKFRFQPTEIKEGEYLVRAINRRNGTYSVSDKDATQKVNTSFVAPEMKNVDIEWQYWKEGTERPTTFIPIIENGRIKDNEENIIRLTRVNHRCTFNIKNNTQIDEKYNADNIFISYYIEEVAIDEETGDIIKNTIYDEEDDSRSITDRYGNEIYPYTNENGVASFEIDEDQGAYRIRIVTRYNGTIRTEYTDIFNIDRNY